ncbi:hypothetical protein [Streptomyces sp. NPDC002276]
MGRATDAATGLATLVDGAGRAKLLHHPPGRRELADSAFDAGRLSLLDPQDTLGEAWARVPHAGSRQLPS